MKKKVILLLGRSGSGKGTQADLLEENFDFDFHVVTGDFFREEAKEDTYIGKKVKHILEEGELAPPWISSFFWERFLIENIKTGKENIIFDGVARRVEEAYHLDDVLEYFNMNLIPVLIKVTQEEAKRRLLGRGRADDNHEDIKERMDWFETEVSKALNYYRGNDRLIEVDGMGSIEEAHNNVIKTLNLNE